MFLFELKNRFIIDPDEIGTDTGKVIYVTSSFKGTIKQR
jgi:hypothetical protein